MILVSCATDMNSWNLIVECMELNAFGAEFAVAGLILFMVVALFAFRNRLPAEVAFPLGLGITYALLWAYLGLWRSMFYLGLVILGAIIFVGLIRFAKK